MLRDNEISKKDLITAIQKASPKQILLFEPIDNECIKQVTKAKNTGTTVLVFVR